MLTTATASSVRWPGNTDSTSMPAATSMISMRHRNEKLSRLRFTMAHQMTNRLMATTPIWCTMRCIASMGTGSPAGKPLDTPRARPNTASPPKMSSMVERGSRSYTGSGAGMSPHVGLERALVAQKRDGGHEHAHRVAERVGQEADRQAAGGSERQRQEPVQHRLVHAEAHVGHRPHAAPERPAHAGQHAGDQKDVGRTRLLSGHDEHGGKRHDAEPEPSHRLPFALRGRPAQRSQPARDHHQPVEQLANHGEHPVVA